MTRSSSSLWATFAAIIASSSAFVASAAAQTPTVNFTLNTSTTASISPYIYGINGTIGSGGFNNLTLTRAGGNRWTAYNWTNNYSNAGSDYHFENDNALSSSTTPGAAVAGTISNGISNNAATLLTIPMSGYVSADAKGGSADVRYYPGTTTFDPNWLADRFKPSLPAKPGGPASFTTNTAALQSASAVYQDEYVNYLKTTYPTAFTANSATPIWFDLDNEPDLWSSTHAEIRPVVAGSVTASNPLGTPTPVTYAELINDTIAYATAIKAVAPNTKIFGPVSYGWNGYTTLQNAPDSGADGDFLTYYLNQVAAASKTAGQRLVDVLDLHWYPEATGAGIRITTQDTGQGYTSSQIAALQTARIQAPRSLWDPTYVESSWITSSLGNQAIQLLPREQAKMTAAANTYGSAYAINQISISEYNYGGGDDISGGIAEADVLGIYGVQGVFSAALWPLASNESFIAGGMAMFRNYDGKGSTFGDISVATTNNNVANASIYASDYSTNSARMTLVAINKTTGNLAAQLPLPNAPNGKAFTIAAVYDLTAASSTPQFVDEIFISNPANFSYTMPGYSVNTIALSAAPASVWSTAASGNWSSTGNWTGGRPNAIGVVAAINASTTAAQTITLDAPETVGTLFLGNSGGTTVGYTLSGTGSNTLTLNNSGNGAVIAVSDGAHAINAPVVLADNLQVCGDNTGWTLSFGTAGIISGTYALNMSGNGTLTLAGQNTYTGVTTLSSGVLNLGAAENVGTSGPLGKSAATNHGSIVFNGGTLQYSMANQYDYSGRFSTAANQTYSVDTNGQNVTWATGLTSSGGSLAKLGNGTLTLSAASTNLSAANISGGGLTFSSGTIGTLNLNTGSGLSTINSGNLATINVNAGGLAISGGTIGASNYNSAAGTNTISAGVVTTVNVNAGGVAINGGTIGTFNHNTGAGASTIGAGATVATLNVNAGAVNFNSTKANGTLALPAGSTGTVIVGTATGGLLPKVATADFSSTPATGTVNAANPLAITSTLKLPGGLSAIISNGASFTATGANLANTSTPSTLGLSGGTLTFPTGAASQTIGVHWAGYGNNTTTPVSGADGVVSQSHWTNVATNWYAGSASNLVNGSGTATTAAVTAAGNGAGTYWWSPSPATGVDNLVWGPGGGNGAIMNAITGIPYSNYEIIAYLNDYQAAGSQFSVWLDGNVASSNPSNAAVAGSRYYYGATQTNPVGFVQATNNSNATTYNNANYVVWTGLSGSSQTLWTEGWSSGGASGNNNEGITGFQIVSTAGPANVNLPATAISVTANSTLDVGEPGTPSQYHTLGALSLTAGTAGGTQLQLQHGLNINFNGISATYPTGGTGAMTANIVNGATSPVISLASGSSVSVDPNVTLTIASTIGDSQTGATAVTKIGAGMLTLTAANTYSGGTTINAGTLRTATNLNNALGTGPLVANAAVSLGGNESTGMLSGSSAGSISVASAKTLAVAQSADATYAGSLALGTTGSGATLFVSGSHSLLLTGSAAINAGSAISVGDGINPAKLRMDAASASTVGASVSVTVAASATLELDGMHPALQDGLNTTIRAHITNSGTLAVGNSVVAPSGTTQQVGGIDGSGSVVVGDTVAASLTADHINQSSLVIGAGSTFTLAPSAADGSPMAGLGVGGGSLMLANSLMPASGFIAPSSNLSGDDGVGSTAAVAPAGGVGSTGTNAVPEPASGLLLGLGALALYCVGAVKWRISVRELLRPFECELHLP